MDLTKYDLNNIDSGEESKPKIEPGVHTLHFDGYEVVNGRNNWEAIKVFFTVGDSGFKINHAFTMGHDNPDVVRRGKHSFKAMADAMGVTSLSSMDNFMDAKVQAPLKNEMMISTWSLMKTLVKTGNLQQVVLKNQLLRMTI